MHRWNQRQLPILAFRALAVVALMTSVLAARASRAADEAIVRVFIFAGPSNMVGSDSKVRDIQRFPPFAGLEAPQENVRFWYCLGRENKTESKGWVPLAPVDDVVGPELSFAREVTRHTSDPVAIIKVAAGGTHLGGDWNPDDPIGFEMYPLALAQVRTALAKLDEQGVAYRIEGFMWHQGENDMFNEEYMANYGPNLKNFIASWRRDPRLPNCGSTSVSCARRPFGAWTSGLGCTPSASDRKR
ncbi:MAG: sialate O-acetylesterase [Pirellulaceae bacterium]